MLSDLIIIFFVRPFPWTFLLVYTTHVKRTILMVCGLRYFTSTVSQPFLAGDGVTCVSDKKLRERKCIWIREIILRESGRRSLVRLGSNEPCAPCSFLWISGAIIASRPIIIISFNVSLVYPLRSPFASFPSFAVSPLLQSYNRSRSIGWLDRFLPFLIHSICLNWITKPLIFFPWKRRNNAPWKMDGTTRQWNMYGKLNSVQKNRTTTVVESMEEPRYAVTRTSAHMRKSTRTRITLQRGIKDFKEYVQWRESGNGEVAMSRLQMMEGTGKRWNELNLRWTYKERIKV